MTVLLEINDVARRIERSPGTVKNETKRGKLRLFAKTPRGLRLYRAEDVDDYLAALAPRRTEDDNEPSAAA